MTRYVDNRDRIRRNIDPDASGCWLWKLSKDHRGYGRVATAEGRGQVAHRVSYAAFVGPIPDGLQLDHLCRVRHCVNPDHLEPVTGRENIRRSPVHHSLTNAAKTACPSGHEYTPENTVMEGKDRSKRRCLACRRAQGRAYKQRRAMRAAGIAA